MQGFISQIDEHSICIFLKHIIIDKLTNLSFNIVNLLVTSTNQTQMNTF